MGNKINLTSYRLSITDTWKSKWFSKSNYVDHTLLNQASILKFIEYNWGLGSIGGSSIDASSNNILNLFDFKSTNQKLILNVDGVIKR